MESISKRRIDRKLLLSDSPTGTNHPRRLSRSSTGHNPLQTPPACLMKTRSSSSLIHQRNVDEWDSVSISCKLQALAKMMHDEFGVSESDSVDFEKGVPLISSPLFERGRFYEEYSARRNERLKSKKKVVGVAMDEKKNRYDLGVRAEPAKRRDSKKFEGTMMMKKKSSNPTTPAKPKPVYSLRSVTKENRRLSLPLSLTASVVGVERKMAAAAARVCKF